MVEHYDQSETRHRRFNSLSLCVVVLHRLKMNTIIENLASCEIRAEMRFSNRKNLTAAEIHRRVYNVYGPSVMSEGRVWQWVRQFNNGRTNVHDEEGSPSIVND